VHVCGSATGWGGVGHAPLLRQGFQELLTCCSPAGRLEAGQCADQARAWSTIWAHGQGVGLWAQQGIAGWSVAQEHAHLWHTEPHSPGAAAAGQAQSCRWATRLPPGACNCGRQPMFGLCRRQLRAVSITLKTPCYCADHAGCSRQVWQYCRANSSGAAPVTDHTVYLLTVLVCLLACLAQGTCMLLV
jgi:hypothetical protein